jgi:hypothetical protein
MNIKTIIAQLNEEQENDRNLLIERCSELITNAVLNAPKLTACILIKTIMHVELSDAIKIVSTMQNNCLPFDQAIKALNEEKKINN